MKKLTMIAASLGLAFAAMPAMAAPWAPISQRAAGLNQRIDQGQRIGGLNRAEAARLHVQVRELQALETRYRRGGFTAGERRDLDQRFDRLSAQIRQQSARRHR